MGYKWLNLVHWWIRNSCSMTKEWMKIKLDGLFTQAKLLTQGRYKIERGHYSVLPKYYSLARFWHRCHGNGQALGNGPWSLNKKTHPTVKILRWSLFKPVGCLSLKCLPQTRTARIKDRHASYFTEVPCFLGPLTLKLISLLLASGASLHLTLSSHPPHRQWGHALLNYVAPEGRA